MLETDNCSDDATCTNTDGSFSCACDDGYTGDGVSCSDNDECALGTDDCGPGFTCSNNAGSYACLDIDECADGTDDCVNGFTCSNTPGSFDCEDVNECVVLDDACGSGYLCINGSGDFQCFDVNECLNETDDCGSGFTCSNTPGSYSCLDDDECALETDNCSDDAECTNTDGSFSCACGDGFSGDGVSCADIDECSNGSYDCDLGFVCSNNPGSYTCDDIDECANETDDCSDGYMCYNNSGSYECILQASAWYSEGENGWTTVSGNLVPFNSTDFENTASATYALMSGDDIIGNEGDLLGAFSNGELRGVAQVVTLPTNDAFGIWSGASEFLLYAYGNNEDFNTEYSLRYYDASDGTDFELSETFTFVSDAVYGSAFSPVVINLNITVSIDAQADAWTWFSVDALTSDMSLSNVLSSIGVADAYIKSPSGFASYISGYGWFGSVSSIDIGSGYQLKIPAGDDQLLTYTGSPVSPSDYPISINSGWNWVGTVSPYDLDIETALGSLSSTVSNNDYIKNSTAFSNYYDVLDSWFGGLTSIKRNEMYKLKSASEGMLVYPTGSMLGRLTEGYANVIDDAFDYSSYENNGSIIVSVSVDDVEVGSSDILTAFIDGEIRGQVNPQLFPLSNEYVFGLMVYGNENTDNINFEYYSHANGKTYMLNHSIVGFESDMIIGSYVEPYTMDDSSDILPSAYSLDKAYPNPFNPTTTIGFNLSNPSYVDVTVYDITGRVVENLVGEFKSQGSHKVVWNASAMSSGVYFVQLNVDGFVDTQKLMLIK